MESALAGLTAMEYPGRVIIVGRNAAGTRTAVLYAITGRSPSSQARRLEVRDGGIWVRPTDEEVLKKGNVDLLVYPAVLFSDRGIAVSNGKQTSAIRSALDGPPASGPVETLARSLADWAYEPDAPIFTPRISGCVLPAPAAALSVIKRAPGGEPLRGYYEIPLGAGRGRLIATYDGVNKDPLASFPGDPVEVGLDASDADGLASAAYEALGPRPGGRDLRVAVACLCAGDIARSAFDVAVINRHERT